MTFRPHRKGFGEQGIASLRNHRPQHTPLRNKEFCSVIEKLFRNASDRRLRRMK